MLTVKVSPLSFHPLSMIPSDTICALEVRGSKHSQYSNAIAQALGLSAEELQDEPSTQPHLQSICLAMRKEDLALLADFAVLFPEDAEVWRTKIRAAAAKVRSD